MNSADATRQKSLAEREPLPSDRIGVLQVVDTLMAGGMERVAVNLANHLPRDRFESHLCTTREEGPLARMIFPSVARLRLNRRSRLDFGAARRLVMYIRANRIDILHAHGTSLFLAIAAASMRPWPAVVWHVHFGKFASENRALLHYRLAVRQAAAVIAVNEALAVWCRKRLRLAADKVSYIPNFATEEASSGPPPSLPGRRGSRIVCVANLRPEKDHLTLLRAMRIVAAQQPQAHLLLVGSPGDPGLVRRIEHEISTENLKNSVTWLGPCQNVRDILRECDVAVLSSIFEGLPMALIEYGAAGLAVVATRVGQCAEVLDEGRAGVLVRPGSAEELAQALLNLLTVAERRHALGRAFRERVLTVFAMEPNVRRISELYDAVLHRSSGGRIGGRDARPSLEGQSQSTNGGRGAASGA